MARKKSTSEIALREGVAEGVACGFVGEELVFDEGFPARKKPLMSDIYFQEATGRAERTGYWGPQYPFGAKRTRLRVLVKHWIYQPLIQFLILEIKWERKRSSLPEI